MEKRHPVFRVPSWMPVYLPSLGAVLRAGGHTVDLFDAGVFPADGSEAAESGFRVKLAAFAPDAIVFDVEAESWGVFRRLANAARRHAGAALLLAGGRHATLCPGGTLKHCPEIDGVMVGEAEGTVSAIAGGDALAGIPGLALRMPDGSLNPAEVMGVTDLDSLPLPAWDLLDMGYYTRRTPRVIPCIPLKTASLESSRGCGAGCTFCAEGRAHSRCHRSHGAGHVVAAIEALVRAYGIEGVYFRDEDFLADTERVKELCNAMRETGLAERVAWSAQCRADRASPEVLGLLRPAGCVQLEFGVESGSQRVLDSISKGSTVEHNAAAIAAARNAGLRSLAYVMYGLPGETAEDISATYEFLERADPDVVRLNAFALYPGAPSVCALEEKGVLKDGWWAERESAPVSDGREFNVSAMGDAQLRAAAGRMYRRHVFRRFARDFAVYNGAADAARCFRPGAAFHFVKKVFR